MEVSNKELFAKVFIWLFFGLILTFGVGYYIQDNENIIQNIFGTSNYLILWIIELVLAIFLSMRIHKMSPVVAGSLYLGYSALTGLTFATLFLTYELTSIIFVFGITSIVLLIFGLIGYFTKIDLTKIGTFLFIGLIGIIIASVVSIFVESVALNLFLIIIGIIIFTGYIAYDIQMLKRRIYTAKYVESLAIFGAFQIYLDFINLFIELLRLFGREK